MSAGEIVAVIFIVVFVIGVIVGVITVTALAAMRTSRLLTGPPHRREDDDDHDADELNEREHGYGIPGHWDGVSTDPGPGPRWPGGEEP